MKTVLCAAAAVVLAVLAVQFSSVALLLVAGVAGWFALGLGR